MEAQVLHAPVAMADHRRAGGMLVELSAGLGGQLIDPRRALSRAREVKAPVVGVAPEPLGGITPCHQPARAWKRAGGLDQSGEPGGHRAANHPIVRVGALALVDERLDHRDALRDRRRRQQGSRRRKTRVGQHSLHALDGGKVIDVGFAAVGFEHDTAPVRQAKAMHAAHAAGKELIGRHSGPKMLAAELVDDGDDAPRLGRLEDVALKPTLTRPACERRGDHRRAIEDVLLARHAPIITTSLSRQRSGSAAGLLASAHHRHH